MPSSQKGPASVLLVHDERIARRGAATGTEKVSNRAPNTPRQFWLQRRVRSRLPPPAASHVVAMLNDNRRNAGPVTEARPQAEAALAAFTIQPEGQRP